MRYTDAHNIANVAKYRGRRCPCGARLQRWQDALCYWCALDEMRTCAKYYQIKADEAGAAESYLAMLGDQDDE